MNPIIGADDLRKGVKIEKRGSTWDAIKEAIKGGKIFRFELRGQLKQIVSRQTLNKNIKSAVKRRDLAILLVARAEAYKAEAFLLREEYLWETLQNIISRAQIVLSLSNIIKEEKVSGEGTFYEYKIVVKNDATFPLDCRGRILLIKPSKSEILYNSSVLWSPEKEYETTITQKFDRELTLFRTEGGPAFSGGLLSIPNVEEPFKVYFGNEKYYLILLEVFSEKAYARSGFLLDVKEGYGKIKLYPLINCQLGSCSIDFQYKIPYP